MQRKSYRAVKLIVNTMRMIQYKKISTRTKAEVQRIVFNYMNLMLPTIIVSL